MSEIWAVHHRHLLIAQPQQVFILDHALRIGGFHPSTCTFSIRRPSASYTYPVSPVEEFSTPVWRPSASYSYWSTALHAGNPQTRQSRPGSCLYRNLSGFSEQGGPEQRDEHRGSTDSKRPLLEELAHQD